MVRAVAVQEELMSAEGEPNAQLLEKVLARFLGDVRASLGNGTLQCAEGAPAAAAAAERQRRLRAELEAQKAVLSVRLDRFLEVRTTSLLLTYIRMPSIQLPDESTLSYLECTCCVEALLASSSNTEQVSGD